MDKRVVIVSLAGIAILSCFPLEVFATVSSDFAGQELMEQSERIQNWIFGAPVRLAGVMAGGYGLFNSIITSSIRPLLMYGAIGLTANVLPSFISSVFNVSGIMISQVIGG